MAETSLAAIRVWLAQQSTLIARMLEDANALAELKGDSPYPLRIPENHAARKRRKRQVKAAPAATVTKRSKKTRRRVHQPRPGEPRTSDYITRVLADARKPLDINTLTDGVLASGWKTASPTPKTIVLQTLYDMRERTKKIRMFGKKGNRQWGFTNWKAAAKAAKAYQNAQANGAEA